MSYQREIEQRGLEIFRIADSVKGASIFNKEYWNGRIMEWSMKNPGFKVQMFRFVDVLPYLTDGGDVLAHLREYFQSPDGEVPKVFKMGVSGLAGLGIGQNFFAEQIRKNVMSMGSIFIVGETPEKALPVLTELRREKLSFTVDLLGEAALSESEALEYQRRYSELLQSLVEQKWPEVELDVAPWGKVARVNLSVKISALFSQTDGSAPEESVRVLRDRLRPLLNLARKSGAFVNLDMEHYGLKELTLRLFRELVDEYQGWDGLGCVIQAYLKDSGNDLEDLVKWAKKGNRTFTVRLVKGAYWDSEIIWAKNRGWPIPVFEQKSHTDASYEDLSRILIDGYPHVRPAFGSHNVRSIAHAMVYAEKRGLPKTAIEFQMLFGMAEPFKKALINLGYRVRDYAPVGELIPGMAYLVRRLLENTSNEGFLKQKFEDGRASLDLLKAPESFEKSEKIVPKNTVAGEPLYFENEPLWDFTVPSVRESFELALKKLKLPLQICPIIDGKPVDGKIGFLRDNPSRVGEIVAESVWADVSQVNQAVKSAVEALPQWRSRNDHAEIIRYLADLMQRDRARISAIMVKEVGKNPKEADGDLAEAIDFCRYYADRSKDLDPKRVSFIPGETSFYEYHPRGVVGVIAPWNFPFAILAGMTVAALVTKNTVLIKPAEQSAAVGSELMRLLLETFAKFKVSPSVAAFLPGDGEVVGKRMVEHPQVSMICFTGSKDVGLLINRTAASSDAPMVKKVVAEMGGKNAIIVDTDADMDEAVMGIIHSAFGFQGQKCSACSRAIILKGNDDRLIERLKEACSSLFTGDAQDLRNFIGPVVDHDSQTRILSIIENAKKRSGVKLIYQGENRTGGFYVAPTIFEVDSPNDPLFQEEIFGPVLTIHRVENLDQALAVANGVKYALTGGFYSRRPSHIDRVRNEFEVGNLYINRGITGALVGRHPFGGFKLSGCGSKAGGPDYLLQFAEPRVWTENTMRRGFAPELIVPDDSQGI